MGSNKTQSNSAPVSPEERQRTYQAAMSNLYGWLPRDDAGFVSEYQPYTAERVSGGDYNKLQGDLLSGYTAAIDRAKSQDSERLDSDLAKRGIWSSGLAVRAQNDLDERYIPQYASAGANATQARYGLQTQELTNVNALNSAEKDRAYQSQWRPADYLAGIWNGTGGVISSSNGGGWSI